MTPAAGVDKSNRGRFRTGTMLPTRQTSPALRLSTRWRLPPSLHRSTDGPVPFPGNCLTRTCAALVCAGQNLLFTQALDAHLGFALAHQAKLFGGFLAQIQTAPLAYAAIGDGDDYLPMILQVGDAEAGLQRVAIMRSGEHFRGSTLGKGVVRYVVPGGFSSFGGYYVLGRRWSSRRHRGSG